MKIGIVVLNYNDSQSVQNLITLISGYQSINHIVIVDNMSTDNSFDVLKNLENNKCSVVSSGRNGGYAYGNNVGMTYLIDNYQSDIIFIANPDVIFEENFVVRIVESLINHKEYAVLSGLMLYPPPPPPPHPPKNKK
ncbi:MAG: glycosyltransferase [Bacteroidales bacterium]|jgi:GT2 family glycosyltransferase|nr:glycosyltransferase [Bacteroidales bacterium]